MTDPDKRPAHAVAADWWRKLNPPDRARSGPQRAAMARLRRAHTPLDAIRESETLRLIRRVERESVYRGRDRIAVLAGILAWVREDRPNNPVARAIGRDSLDDALAAMSEARFRRLLQTGDEGLMDAMRRLVVVLDRRVDVFDLSRAVLYWGDGTRKGWIFDYYNVGAAAPGGPSTERRGDSAP